MKPNIYILLIFLSLVFSCEKDIEFKYDINLLINNVWGIPQVIDVSPLIVNPDLSAPTNFQENGIVVIANQYEDFWRIYNSTSITLQNLLEIWQINELNDSTLHVHKLRYPDGEYLMECVYLPAKK